MYSQLKYSVLIISFFIISCNQENKPHPDTLVEGLDFPVQNASDLEKYYCFGLQPWDTQGNNEIHGGIDLVAKYDTASTTIRRVPIIAPADAKVERIIESVSGAEAKTLVVLLKMNDYWYIVCNFEPQTTDSSIFEEQRRSIAVIDSQQVRRGQVIGELVISQVKPGSYPHLHYGFFYKHPDQTLEDIYMNYLLMRRSDGTDFAPITGLGSPWQPIDLGIQTTFYCPYEYSTPRAQAAYNSLLQIAANGDVCKCICAYRSVQGNCGICE